MKKLNLAEHKELGIRLKQLDNCSHRCLKIMMGRLPKTKPPYKLLCKIEASIGELRSLMDDKLQEDYPELEDREFLSTYYSTGDTGIPLVPRVASLWERNQK